MSHAFKNNNDNMSSYDRTYKNRLRVQYDFAKNAAINNFNVTNNFQINDTIVNSKNIKKISHFRDYSLLIDLNKAKTISPCETYDGDKFDISLCDLSFNQNTGLETGNDLNDILNTQLFNGNGLNIIYDLSGQDPAVDECLPSSGAVFKTNGISCGDSSVLDYIIDPSGSLFNNNCSSSNNHLGFLRNNVVTYDPSMVPIGTPPNPLSNQLYKNRFNNVNCHNGVYFNQ